MERRDFGKPKRVVVARTCAHCARCGGEEFVRMRRRAEERIDLLVCYACGAEYFYSQLLQQIANTVIARSERLLDKAHRTSGKPKP